ncbi:MAG: Rieske 2Fe-2S domain-containing protein [Solirubrobacteraceae bacterium]|nr:Rieske 2Fe-2S domain-containing protein [Solirubrobacteraceae bacterium]
MPVPESFAPVMTDDRPATPSALVAAGYVAVGAVDDVPMLEGRRTTVRGRRIAVFRLPAGFAAIDADCPHAGGPLHDGLVADDCVTCPLHGWRIDLTDGTVVGEGARVGVHDVVERDGRIYVRPGAGDGIAGACAGHGDGTGACGPHADRPGARGPSLDGAAT